MLTRREPTLIKISSSAPITTFNSDYTLYMINRFHYLIIASQIDLSGTAIGILNLHGMLSTSVMRSQ